MGASAELLRRVGNQAHGAIGSPGSHIAYGQPCPWSTRHAGPPPRAGQCRSKERGAAIKEESDAHSRLSRVVARASRPCATPYKVCQPGRGDQETQHNRGPPPKEGRRCADTTQRRGGQTDAGHHQQQQATVAHPRPGLKRGRGQISLRIALVSPQTVCLGQSDIVSGTIRHQPDIRQRSLVSRHPDIMPDIQTYIMPDIQTVSGCLLMFWLSKHHV